MDVVFIYLLAVLKYCTNSVMDMAFIYVFTYLLKYRTTSVIFKHLYGCGIYLVIYLLKYCTTSVIFKHLYVDEAFINIF